MSVCVYWRNDTVFISDNPKFQGESEYIFLAQHNTISQVLKDIVLFVEANRDICKNTIFSKAYDIIIEDYVEFLI